MKRKLKKKKSGVVKKNVIEGNINNVNNLKIGDEYNIYSFDKKLSKELSLNLPKIHPDDIVGREDDLKKLYDFLSHEQRMVVVNGLGGIGKTTLAQGYISKYYEEYKHIVWINQNSENITEDFLNDSGLITNLSVEIGNKQPEQVFNEIIIKLKSISDFPNLMIIDNGEHNLSKYLTMLPNQPRWHMLVTSREEIAGLYAIPLGFLNEQNAINLFKKYYFLDKLIDQDIKNLVETVDYHTLTIEILAKTAQVQRYDAATLKQAVEKDLRANIEIAHNKVLGRIEKVGSYLRTVFSLSKLSENEIWFLKQFICLPPEFHTYDSLKVLLINEESAYKAIFNETLANISQKGWLLRNRATDSYKLHRIIKEVVKNGQPLRIADVQHL